MSNTALIDCVNITKDYVMGVETVHALRGVSVKIMAGEFVAVLGPSGSGKSTFMNLMGALDVPTAGSLKIDGHEVTTFSKDELAAFRNETVGFVFQQFNLLARTSALNNVMLPLLYREMPAAEREERVIEALEKVNLVDRMDHHPNQLSGGQQQRVAIARALVTNPRLILADEPTGALDTKTGQEIMELLDELNKKGITIVLITHEREIADYAQRQIFFRDGEIVKERLKAA